jgi:hypothetical protein
MSTNAIVNFRFFFTKNIKTKLQDNNYLTALSNLLMESWNTNAKMSSFFGVFGEKVDQNRIEVSVWTESRIEFLIDSFKKSWYSILVDAFVHVNNIPNGENIDGYFADIRLNSETGDIQVLPIDDILVGI